MKRSTFLHALLATGLCPTLSKAAEHLPQNRTFIRPEYFYALVKRAKEQQWQNLPMGQRVQAFGQSMCGIKYVGFTLEIDNKIESPSANFAGLDCWTFFEIALGLARMIEVPKAEYRPSDLLKEIEWTRYRGGVCTGDYLERIHYLAEWYYENEARGSIQQITRQIGPAVPLTGRVCQEMTVLWKSYRYLRNNPSLLKRMGEIEARESQLPFYYIPKSQVASIESKIQGGDIIGIVTKHQGGHCSHVGLAYRGRSGVCHFMHASKKHKKVLIDASLSNYLYEFKSHIGIIVGRPLQRSNTIHDQSTYQQRLAMLTRS